MTILGSHNKQAVKSTLIKHIFHNAFVVRLLMSLLLIVISNYCMIAQSKVWSVDDCIKYALEQNIQILQAKVASSINEENVLLSKAGRLPSVSGSARQSYSWGNQYNQATGATVFSGAGGTNLSASSNVTVFNSGKIQNNIKKSETDFEAGQYSVEVIKESVSLSVHNA
jgi:outer membrane protein